MKIFLTAAVMLVLMTGIGAVEARANGDVGSVAPDFQLENVLDGAPDSFALSSHRGSVVVIAFFAWW